MDDGSGITTLISTNIDTPNDVVVDVELDLMYWCDGGKRTIGKVLLGTMSSQSLIPPPWP